MTVVNFEPNWLSGNVTAWQLVSSRSAATFVPLHGHADARGKSLALRGALSLLAPHLPDTALEISGLATVNTRLGLLSLQDETRHARVTGRATIRYMQLCRTFLLRSDRMQGSNIRKDSQQGFHYN